MKKFIILVVISIIACMTLSCSSHERSLKKEKQKINLEIKALRIKYQRCISTTLELEKKSHPDKKPLIDTLQKEEKELSRTLDSLPVNSYQFMTAHKRILDICETLGQFCPECLGLQNEIFIQEQEIKDIDKNLFYLKLNP